MKKKQPEEKKDSAVVLIHRQHPDPNLTYNPEKVELITPKQDITFELLDAHLDTDKYKIKIISSRKWYVRLWYLVSNPLCYIFKGYVRY